MVTQSILSLAVILSAIFLIGHDWPVLNGGGHRSTVDKFIYKQNKMIK